MSNTRKYIDEQFDKFFEFDTDDRSTVTSISCKLFAEHCIQQLLAVIAAKDEALNRLHTLQYQSDSNEAVLANHSAAYDIVNDALAIKPGDVTLVEVMEATGGGMLYTIKTKE